MKDFKLMILNNEPSLIERIYKGDNRAFSTLYEKYRSKFFGYFQKSDFKGEKDEQIADLYQNSCLKLYNQIITGKMFAQDKNIYIRNKEGKINILSAKLDTYLIGIGRFSKMEMQRDERKYVDFDPFESVLTSNDYNPVDSEEINPLYDIADDLFFEDEEKFSLVRTIVKNMGKQCKDIFTYYYFGDNGDKMSLKEIADKMPNYSSADSVKNQKSRCHKKFKVAYMRALSEQ